MTNTEMLSDKIKNSGLKMGFISKELKISRQQFWKKLNNLVSFNQYEIEKLCELLKISSLREKESIFFAK